METTPSPLQPRRVAAFSRYFAPFARVYFRYEMHGVEQLPPPPCLFVSNQSAEGVVEIVCLVAEFHRQVKGQRWGVGLTHDTVLKLPVIGSWASSIGSIPANRQAALAALRSGKDAIVYPGGDREAARPFYQPRALLWSERRGYVRLALEAGVPVIPTVTTGAFYTYLMFPGGYTLARVLGLKKRFRIDALALPIQLIVCLILAFVAAASGHWLLALIFAILAPLPFPARVTTRFLPAIDLARQIPEDLPEAERVERAHALIHGAIARALEEPERRPELIPRPAG